MTNFPSHNGKGMAGNDSARLLVNSVNYYSASRLKDSYGRIVKITSIPDRAKGMSIYGGRRVPYSRMIITEQVYDVAAKFVRGNVDFDEDNADWVVIPTFHLPPGWAEPIAPLLILFPTDYPAIPPIGFYLPNRLQSPNQHFFNRTYHGASDAPIQEGWNWYCCTVNPGAWQPYPARRSGEWLRGDNLWTYITLINEVLGSPVEAD